MAKNACILKGCQMAASGCFNECPTGVCIDDKAFSAGHLPTQPLWRMPIANVFSNDAAQGHEWANNAMSVDQARELAARAAVAPTQLVVARPGSWLQALCMRALRLRLVQLS